MSLLPWLPGCQDCKGVSSHPAPGAPFKRTILGNYYLKDWGIQEYRSQEAQGPCSPTRILRCNFHSRDVEGFCLNFHPFPEEKKTRIRDNKSWRDGLPLKNTCCCYRGPGVDAQNLHCGSQPSIMPVPGDLAPPSGCTGHYAHVMHRHICSQTTHTHKNF